MPRRHARLARNAEAVAGAAGARPRRRCGPATRPRQRSRLEAARKRSAEGGAETETRTGSDGSTPTWPCCATWTPSTSSAGPPSRTEASGRGGGGDADPGRPEAVRGRPRRGVGGRCGGAGVRVGGAASGSCRPWIGCCGRTRSAGGAGRAAGRWMPTRTGTRSGTRSSPVTRRRWRSWRTSGRPGATAGVRRLPGRERGDPGGAAAAVVAGGGESTAGRTWAC